MGLRFDKAPYATIQPTRTRRRFVLIVQRAACITAA